MGIFTFIQHQATNKVMDILEKVRLKNKRMAEKKEMNKKQPIKSKPKTKQDLEKMYTEFTSDEIKFLINMIGKAEFLGKDVQLLYSIVAKLQNKLNK